MNRVENNVANGEIARYEQFLHFPQCFQKSSAAKGVRKRFYVGQG